MVGAPDYHFFGGVHGESAAMKNLLGYYNVKHPLTGGPISEALCFGIAGGIGAGYSYCPSVVRHGKGSGVTIIGRHKVYATGAGWYQEFFDRIGVTTRITETAAKGKAYQNLITDLKDGRPTVVWCSREHLPFLAMNPAMCGLLMHTFIVYAIDEGKGVAYGSDHAESSVSLTLDVLAEARDGVCSHKNRTLTLDRPKSMSEATLREAIQKGMKACAQELLTGKMKTFSLPGLDTWAKMITNDKNKDGWLKVFENGLLYCALKDVYHSVITNGSDGFLFRKLYSEFLLEAATFLPARGLEKLAATYSSLGHEWVGLAEFALRSDIKPFKKARELLARCWKHIQKGDKGCKGLAETRDEMQKLEAAVRKDFPLSPTETREHLDSMRVWIEELHRKETEAAKRLQEAGK